MGPLAKDLEGFLRGNRESLLINFLPNLVWSVDSLQLQDEALWTSIDRLVLKISSNFSINQLASLMPAYKARNPRVAQSLLERFTSLPRSDSKDYQICEDTAGKLRERAESDN